MFEVAFLEALYERVPAGHVFEVGTPFRSPRRYFAPSQIEEALEWSAGRNGFYFTPAVLSAAIAAAKPPKGEGCGAGNDDITYVTAVWLDVDTNAACGKHTGNAAPDCDTALKIVDSLPLPASAVWWTGHGLQAAWLLVHTLSTQTELERAYAKRTLTSWIEAAKVVAAGLGVTGGVDDVNKIAALLRMPGTLNRKDACGAGHAVEMLRVNPELRFRPDQLIRVAQEVAPHLLTSPPEKKSDYVPVQLTPEQRTHAIRRAWAYISKVPVPGTEPGDRGPLAYKLAARLVRDFALPAEIAEELLDRFFVGETDKDKKKKRIQTAVHNAIKYGKNPVGVPAVVSKKNDNALGGAPNNDHV